MKKLLSTVLLENLAQHEGVEKGNPRGQERDAITVRDRLDRLAELDLSQVHNKLMQPDHGGQGWTREQADLAEKWYLRYLTLVIRFPKRVKHVPNGPIDAFWHQHILDTQKYHDDCNNVLGYYLHHNPYYGMNGDKEEHGQSFKDTNALFREVYGEDCLTMVSLFPEGEGAYCGTDGATCNNE